MLVVETKSLCVVEQAYQKLREEKNRFSQSFDIWTQSSIQSCFHTFIHQTFTVFPNSQSKTFSIFVAPSKNMSHYLVWDIPPPTTSSSRWLTIRKLRENIVTALHQKLTKVTQSQNMNIASCRLSGSLLLASKIDLIKL